jgi:hypothetical protein
VTFHLVVRGRMYSLPVAVVAALLLAGEVEAAEQWTVAGSMIGRRRRRSGCRAHGVGWLALSNIFGRHK